MGGGLGTTHEHFSSASVNGLAGGGADGLLSAKTGREQVQQK
jgi:hypothetical protein